MSKTKKTSRENDLRVINGGNMEEIKAAIEAFAFDQETQIHLIKTPSLRPILDLYMSLRKLGKQPLTHLLSAPRGKYDEALIKAAVIGNILSEHNQGLLEQNYPELLPEYNATKKAIEEEKEKEMKRFNQPCSMSMASLFTPELRAKLAI